MTNKRNNLVNKYKSKYIEQNKDTVVRITTEQYKKWIIKTDNELSKKKYYRSKNDSKLHLCGGILTNYSTYQIHETLKEHTQNIIAHSVTTFLGITLDYILVCIWIFTTRSTVGHITGTSTYLFTRTTIFSTCTNITPIIP